MTPIANCSLRSCAVVALLLASSAISSVAADFVAAPKLFYGGFAFAGRASELARNYPIATKLASSKGEEAAFTQAELRDLFIRNASLFHNVSFSLDLARPHDTPQVLALALTNEKILRENLGDFQKLVIQLGFELLVLNFDTMEVVSSQPICIELIDAGQNERSDDDVSLLMSKMVKGPNSQLSKAIVSKIKNVRLGAKNQATLQIRNVTIGEKSLPFLPEAYRQAIGTYSQAVAQQFGSLLTSQAGLAMLPYAKDGLNSKMALRFSDASILDFAIPPPTFAIDLDVRGFKKVLSKSTDAESLWLYGAFLNIRVYEPTFKLVYFDAPVKFGVPKVIPHLQTNVDEFPVVSEALTGAFLAAIDQMHKNPTTNDKVLNKCQQ